MRIVNFCIAAAYLVLAFISVNEPQPAIWILINGSMAVVTLMAMFSLYLQKVVGGLFTALGVYSFFMLDGFLSWMKNPDLKGLFTETRFSEDHIMDAKHFLVLAASEVILLIYLIRSRKRKNALVMKK